jgi:CRP-like cAMP-binding protein
MRTNDPKLELIRRLPTFAGAGTREIRSIAEAVDVAVVEAGRVLCRAGRRALESYVVVDGTVDIVIDGQIVATLGRGEIVGEVGVIDGLPRTADVIASSPARVLAIPAPTVRALVETSHSFRMALLRQMAGRVRSLDLEQTTAPEAIPAA